MSLFDNLNFLSTIGTFGCVSFALSGIGVKLGKYSSYPHQLGFNYISETTDSDKLDKLYDATAKINENINTDAPIWAKKKDELKNWCKDYEKSTKYWKDASKYCLIKRNVWHQLILDSVNFKNDTPTKEPSLKEAIIEVENQKCTYELLNRYADSPNHINYLIGKRACAPL